MTVHCRPSMGVLDRLVTCRSRPNINGIELCIEKHLTPLGDFVNSVKCLENDRKLKFCFTFSHDVINSEKDTFFRISVKSKYLLKPPINFKVEDYNIMTRSFQETFYLNTAYISNAKLF